MERQGLGTRGWGSGSKGAGLGTLLGLAILVMRSAAAFAAASGSGSEGELGITVRVYDYAHVDRGTLITAEKRAASIFRVAGLVMRWCDATSVSANSPTDPSCNPPASRPEFMLRIVPRLKTVRGETTDSTMGFAVGN